MQQDALLGSITRMELKYQGLDADKHILDAIQLTRSLDGNARLYRLVAHYCVYGEVLSPRAYSDLKCYASPAAAGSYEQALVILAGGAQQVLAFADVYRPALDWLIAKLVGFIKDHLSGNQRTDALVDAIKSQAEQDHELQTLLANGLIKANDNLAALQDKLISTLPDLVKAAQPSFRKAISPIGRSCGSLTQFHDQEDPIRIDEVEALAIRSDEDLAVGETAIFTINRIRTINLDTGTCRLEVEGIAGHVTGIVRDIALSTPDNPYSSALNSHSSLKVRARPVYRAAELYRLYISEPSS